MFKSLKTTRTVLAAMAVLSLFGCVEEGEEHVIATQRQEIQGGSVDDVHTSVVGIVMEFPGGGQGICSGTLIAPNLVLTARHCVAELTSQFVVCGEAPFGNTFPASNFHVSTQTQLPQSGSGYYGVRTVYLPPGTNDTCGYDIALLELNQNIPANVTEPTIPRIDEPVVVGETYTAVGYGHIGDGSGSGTRRMLDGRRVACRGAACGANSGIVANEFAGSDGTCQGDSGGAAIDSEGRVLGALSRGPEGCAGSVYSAVYEWADWMRNSAQTAAVNGGYTAPNWVTTGSSTAPVNDPDGDGILDPVDNCPMVPNNAQLDLDLDGIGDECDDDLDGDGLFNDGDNCPLYENPQQLDNDLDSFGDACDLDDDNDGVMDVEDNCQFMPNASQADICYGNGTFNPNPQPGGASDPGSPSADPEVVVMPEGEKIHLEGRMNCAVGGGSPVNFLSLVLFVAGFLRLPRRR